MKDEEDVGDERPLYPLLEDKSSKFANSVSIYLKNVKQQEKEEEMKKSLNKKKKEERKEIVSTALSVFKRNNKDKK